MHVTNKLQNCWIFRVLYNKYPAIVNLKPVKSHITKLLFLYSGSVLNEYKTYIRYKVSFYSFNICFYFSSWNLRFPPVDRIVIFHLKWVYITNTSCLGDRCPKWVKLLFLFWLNRKGKCATVQYYVNTNFYMILMFVYIQVRMLILLLAI